MSWARSTGSIVSRTSRFPGDTGRRVMVRRPQLQLQVVNLRVLGSPSTVRVNRVDDDDILRGSLPGKVNMCSILWHTCVPRYCCGTGVS